MAIKLVDELKAMGNFPIAHAEGINLVKTDGTEDNLQNLFDNGELIGGGGDSSVTLTQQEYEALSEEQKLGGLYYTYDTKRIYKNGVQYGASDAEGIGYNNAESGIQATTVQGAIDKVVKTVEDTYAKTTDIPTTLPANGGNANTVNNHTVKSDVPENAVFTDTIYDDTEVKGKLNGLINDTKVTTTNTFSSDKIKAITNEIKKFTLSKTDYQGVEAYPTECGVYRVIKKIDGIPNDASQYATLIIYGNGYFTHIYHDTFGRMWIGYTADSVKAPTWKELVTMGKVVKDSGMAVETLYNNNTGAFLKSDMNLTATRSGILKVSFNKKETGNTFNIYINGVHKYAYPNWWGENVYETAYVPVNNGDNIRISTDVSEGGDWYRIVNVLII